MIADLRKDGTLVNGIDRLHFTEWIKTQVTKAKYDMIVFFCQPRIKYCAQLQHWRSEKSSGLLEGESETTWGKALRRPRWWKWGSRATGATWPTTATTKTCKRAHLWLYCTQLKWPADKSCKAKAFFVIVCPIQVMRVVWVGPLHVPCNIARERKLHGEEV